MPRGSNGPGSNSWALCKIKSLVQDKRGRSPGRDYTLLVQELRPKREVELIHWRNKLARKSKKTKVIKAKVLLFKDGKSPANFYNP